MKDVRFETGASLAVLAMVVVLLIPSIGLFLDHEDLADRHGRELGADPEFETLWVEPRTVFEAGETWVRDRIGFGLSAGQGYRWFSYYILGDDPAINVQRNGEFVFLTSHSAGRVDPLSAVRRSCPPQTEWGRVYDQAHARWTRLSESLSEAGYQPSLLIIPSKKTLYADKLPLSVGTQLRQLCLAMGVPEDPAVRLAEQDPNVIYPLMRFHTLRDEPQFYPPENFHSDGYSAFIATQEFFSEVLGEITIDMELTLIEGPADIKRAVGFDRVIAFRRPDYAMLGIRNYRRGREVISQNVPRATAYTAYANNSTAPPRSALIVANSFGQYLARPFATGFSEVYHINVNAFPVEALGDIFNAFLQSQPVDQIIFVIHDGAFYDSWMAPVAEAIENFGAVERPEMYRSQTQETLTELTEALAALEGRGRQPFGRQFSDLLGQGWYPPEAQLVWGRSGVRNDLLIPRAIANDIGPFEVRLGAFSGGEYFTDEVIVRVCGQDLPELARALTQGGVWVRLPAAENCNFLPTLSVFVPEQPSPNDLGRSSDQRHLGVRLAGIRAAQ